jgi:hypothetical protein
MVAWESDRPRPAAGTGRPGGVTQAGMPSRPGPQAGRTVRGRGTAAPSSSLTEAHWQPAAGPQAHGGRTTAVTWARIWNLALYDFIYDIRR